MGAVGMLATGVLTLEQGYLAQDYPTLILLFSMMLVVSFLLNSGMLEQVQGLLDSLGAHPSRLLWAVIMLTGSLSALFINDVVCLVMTPMLLRTVRSRGLNPLPYVLAVALAANIGSLATPIGNPQNAFIASLAGIDFRTFVLHLAPLALVGLLLCGSVLTLLYRNKLDGGLPTPLPQVSVPPIIPYVVYRTVAVLILLVIGFWGGWPLPIVAAAGASVLLLTRRVPRRALFRLVDWDLLVLFMSLFVLVEGARLSGILTTLYRALEFTRPDTALGFSAVVLIFSNLFSNVPAALFLADLLTGMSDPTSFALLFAAVCTLSGNLTLVGSIANLIVAEKAKEVVQIGFWDFARAGIPVTVLCLTTTSIYWYALF